MATKQQITFNILEQAEYDADWYTTGCGEDSFYLTSLGGCTDMGSEF